MSEEQSSWAIAITFCDEENQGFVTLGGAAWHDKDEWDRQWSSIPEASPGRGEDSMIVADKVDDSHDLVDDKPITRATVEMLLGRPVDELIAEGRERTAFTMGQLMKQDPDLASSFRAVRQGEC